ncbi:hypothetical protein ACFSX5_06705 [Devosia albogilva]|uniref:Pentapeptide repeat-containing protein n=1 Tax=Devosia albogilva TaxID=429726 RepID=A0ABW5QJG4_9HYPH
MEIVNSAPLEADCSRCFGLCCIALSFSRSEDFGHDKLAGEACHHLDRQFRCRIHQRRSELGYDGCEAFDCLGAGQRASALFPDLHWRRDPMQSGRVFAAFSILLKLQEMRQALTTAAELSIGPALQAERAALLAELSNLADSRRPEAGAAALLSQARDFLTRLRPVLEAEPG